MKREDVKNKIPGITDEQLNWLMQENGADPAAWHRLQDSNLPLPVLETGALPE